MKLRIKTHIAIALILTALAALAIFSTKMTMLDEFEEIEKRLAVKGTATSVALTVKAIGNLENLAADWSYWDETYEYAESPNEGYIKRNCYPEGLTSLGIDLIAIFNTEGEQVLAIGNDPWEVSRAPMPAGWLEAVGSWPAFFTPPSYTAAVSGILMLPEGPVMVAARQILSSERKGPTHGTLFMGKKIDARRIESWKETLPYPLRIYDAGADDLPRQVQMAGAELEHSERRTAVAPLNGETMAAYAKIRDITGRQMLILESLMPRTVYRQAVIAMRHYVITIAAFSIVLWLTAAVFTERGLVGRIIGLDAQVDSIARSGNALSRLETRGKDEISRLGESINRMLASLSTAQEALARSNEKLERANSAKTDFTSMVSHELRTPLGTIKQALELIHEGADGPISEKQGHRLDVARRNVDRLVRLTNELLDFTRLETGRIDMNFEKNDLGAMLGDVFQLMKPAADEKGVALILNAPSGSKEIVCDADKIKQALINLVNNATKFTEMGGKITLSAEPVDDGVRIKVEDTGRGVKEEDLPKLFEPFRQIKDGKASSSAGSGLGLSICSLLVKRHGGSIGVKSVFGEGTTFSITLPDRPPEQHDTGGLSL